MPRPKTLGDAEVLAAAHRLVHERGPSALTLAALARACGLSASTLVQRFESKPQLMRSTLSYAWDRLDERTAELGAVPKTADGAIALLAGPSRLWWDRVLRGRVAHPAGGPSRPRTAGARRGLEGVAVAGHRGLLLRHAARTAGHRSAVGSAVAGVTAVVELDPQGDVVGYVEDGLRHFVSTVIPARRAET